MSCPCSLPKFESRLTAEAEPPADEAQIGLDEHAVAEQEVEEARIAEEFDDLMHAVVEAVERVDPALDQKEVGEPRQGVNDRASPTGERSQIERQTPRPRPIGAKERAASHGLLRDEVRARGQRREGVDDGRFDQGRGDGE